MSCLLGVKSQGCRCLRRMVESMERAAARVVIRSELRAAGRRALEVALSFGSVPDGRTTTLIVSPVINTASVGGNSSLPGPDRPPRWADPQAARRVRSKPSHGREDDLGILDAYRQLIGLIDPIAACDLVQPVRDAPSLRLQARSERQHPYQR